jgi:hypothetical protein
VLEHPARDALFSATELGRSLLNDIQHVVKLQNYCEKFQN